MRRFLCRLLGHWWVFTNYPLRHCKWCGLKQRFDQENPTKPYPWTDVDEGVK